MLIDQTDGRRERELSSSTGSATTSSMASCSARWPGRRRPAGDPLGGADRVPRRARPRREDGSHRHRQRRRGPHRHDDLIERGRRGSPPRRAIVARGRDRRLRLAGYTEALTEAGLPLERVMVQAAGTWHRADGVLADKRLIESGCGRTPSSASTTCSPSARCTGSPSSVLPSRRRCGDRHRRHRGRPLRTTDVDQISPDKDGSPRASLWERSNKK